MYESLVPVCDKFTDSPYSLPKTVGVEQLSVTDLLEPFYFLYFPAQYTWSLCLSAVAVNYSLLLKPHLFWLSLRDMEGPERCQSLGRLWYTRVRICWYQQRRESTIYLCMQTVSPSLLVPAHSPYSGSGWYQHYLFIYLFILISSRMRFFFHS